MDDIAFVVGLNGYAGVGKDVFADVLVEDFGFAKYSFSDPLMQSLLAIDPIIYEPLAVKPRRVIERLSRLVNRVGWTEAKRTPEVRRILQKLGTEAGRDIHGEDCWVKLMMEKLIEDKPTRVVITNIRFQNEAELVRNCSDALDCRGMLIRIARDGFTPALGHSSDVGCTEIEVDLTVQNNGSIEDFKHHARSTMEAYINEHK